MKAAPGMQRLGLCCHFSNRPAPFVEMFLGLKLGLHNFIEKLSLYCITCAIMISQKSP